MFIDVLKEGIIPNKDIDNTEDVQRLIDSIKSSGGTVYFPRGVYSVGSIRLYSNITILLDNGAEISAVADYEKYPVITEQMVNGFVRGTRQGIFFALNEKNICIKGEGTINGNGENWWFKGESDEKRPRAIQFIGCEDVLIQGISIINSPCWTVHPICCNNITINNITIRNPYESPNTDGINPESCKNVKISDCYIDVGDDCLTLKSGLEKDIFQKQRSCENVTVTNCTFVHGHGGIVIGSEMSGGVKNITVSNCIFQNTDRGVRIKTRRGRGGVVEDILISNLIMDNVDVGITINGFYACGANEDDMEIFAEDEKAITSATPSIKNIMISNIIIKNAKGAGIYFFGLPENPIENVKITNIDIRITPSKVGVQSVMAPRLPKSFGEGIFLKNVKGIVINDCSIQGALDELILTNAIDTFINGELKVKL